MKISLGAKLQEGAWGGGNQVIHALADYLRKKGVEVSFTLDDPALDLILMVEPDTELRISAYGKWEIRDYLRSKNPNAIVVHRLNNTSEARDDDAKLYNRFRIAANSIADHSIFISQWVYERYVESGFLSPAYTVVKNGGDSDFWKPGNSDTPTPPYKLVTHHWSKNQNKGFDIYGQLDELLGQREWSKRVQFTYIGQIPDDFIFNNSHYLEPLAGEALRAELQKHHIYLTASQHEAAGMHHIEGALCGLPLLYRESGALPEYCADFGLGFTTENFTSQLENMLNTYEQWHEKMPDYPYTAERMCENYYRLFEDLIHRRDEILAARQERITVLSKNDETWLNSLRKNIKGFLDSVHVQNGRYLPASEGVTNEGNLIKLPFSCFALKIAYMLSLWDELPESEQQAWISYIQDFQQEGNPLHVWTGRNAFVDMELLKRVRWQTRRIVNWKNRILTPKHITYFQATISAETKQAIATLAEVNAQSRYPYKGFPNTPREMERYFSNFDWAKPWESAAHLATIAVFLKTEAPRWMSPAQVDTLHDFCSRFIDDLVDAESGAYFHALQTPEYGQLINGAMKVLTALDWLEKPIHYPEKLIDTALKQLPLAEGCHLVAAVYVLYRCRDDYRRAEIEEYCREILNMIREHQKPDGGFSYYLGYSQPQYHRVRITHGHAVSDMHGTVLLTWAVAMIREILGLSGWRVIKP